MIVEVPRRWRWGIGGLVIVSLLELGWLWFGLGGEPEREAVSVATTVDTTRSDESPPSTEPGAAAPSSDRSQGVEGEVLMCNTWVKVKLDGTPDEVDFDRAARVPEVRQKLLSTLRADSSDYLRALAILVESNGADAEQRAAMSHAEACDAACDAAREQLSLRRARGRDALAKISASTSDPRVYALGFMTCASPPQASGDACQMLSAAQWARLDPGNAEPWLYALSQAAKSKDAAGVQDALFHIATSQRSELHYMEPTGTLLSKLPDDESSSLAVLSLAYESAGAQAALALPGYADVLRLCRGSELRDANRRQVCQSIAETFSLRSDTMIEHTIGAAMGERLGWPVAVTDRMRGERAMYEKSGKGSASDPTTMTCASIADELTHIRRVASVGETGVMREWLARSGIPVDELVRQGQMVRAQRDASAASAAATAANASATASAVASRTE
jgi:hypothetical protein